jgi:polar amino acid transport system substrate-binding protein
LANIIVELKLVYIDSKLLSVTIQSTFKVRQDKKLIKGRVMQTFTKSFILVSVLSSSAVLADTISIRADNWFPMNGQPNAKQPGYMIELATNIFTAAGHTVDYKLMPWERAVDSVRKGEFDCVVGAYKDDAPDFIYPQVPWGMDSTVFFVKAGGSWTYTGLSSLQGNKIAIIKGYAYGDEFDKYVTENPSVFDAIGANNGLENNIKKLQAGRVNAVAESPSVMGAKLKDMGVSGIVAAGSLGEATEMYIACSPAKATSAGYIKLIDEGTAKLRASGEFNKILSSYGISDWQ